jgi:hypothetical protein
MNPEALCQYRNILGEPREGVHRYRFFDLAIVDLALTVLGAFILSRLLAWPFYSTLAGLFISGIAAHRLFCVRTTVDRWLDPVFAGIFGS